MQTLEEYMPNETERELTAAMPEQVAIGFIRARRKDRTAKHLGVQNNPGLGDIFGDMFRKPRE